MPVVTRSYPSRATVIRRTLFACHPLLARQTHVFGLLYDMRVHLRSVRLRSQRRLLDNMRTILCRLFSKDELPDLTILPSGTWSRQCCSLPSNIESQLTCSSNEASPVFRQCMQEPSMRDHNHSFLFTAE
jgi:hypothetical protein